MKKEGRCGGCVLDKLSFFNEEPTIETYTQTDPLQETVKIQLRRPRGPSFLLEQLERGQVLMRPG